MDNKTRKRDRDLKAKDLNVSNGSGVDSLHYKWKLFEKRLDYSQAAFDHHAKQRMQMFNFFVLFAALAANACTGLFTEGNYLTAAIVALLGSITSFVFYILDLRNEELVHIAEANLKALEKDVLFKGYRRNATTFKKKWHRGNSWLPWWRSDDNEVDKQLGVHLREDPGYKGLKQRDDLNPDELAESTPSWTRHGFWIPFIQLLFGAAFMAASLIAVNYWCDEKNSKSESLNETPVVDARPYHSKTNESNTERLHIGRNYHRHAYSN